MIPAHSLGMNVNRVNLKAKIFMVKEKIPAVVSEGACLCLGARVCVVFP